MRTVLLVLCAAFSLCSCAAPSKEEIAQADIGPRPENAEQLVRDHFAQTLFDPYSAVYTFDYGPERGYFTALDTTIGWVICGSVNAKNRMGGYVGAKRFRAVIVRGRVAEGATVIGDPYAVCQM